MSALAASRVGLVRAARLQSLCPQRHVAAQRKCCRTVAPRAVPWWGRRDSAEVQEKKAQEALKQQLTAVADMGVPQKNKFLVETLGEKLPQHRDQVTDGMLAQLGMATGFSPEDIFRKFLWYVLKDRKFDQAAVDDLAHLKQELALSNDDVAEALCERCLRIEKKFGNLVIPPEGVSEKVLQQKATTRTMFAKMLYLTETEQMLQPNKTVSADIVRKIFAATDDDIQQLKIVSLL